MQLPQQGQWQPLQPCFQVSLDLHQAACRCLSLCEQTSSARCLKRFVSDLTSLPAAQQQACVNADCATVNHYSAMSQSAPPAGADALVPVQFGPAGAGYPCLLCFLQAQGL